MSGRKREEGGRGRVSPAAAIICRVRLGDLIQAEEKICEEPWVHTRLIRNYEVKEIYPHHVLTEDTATGQRRCFCYGDLILRSEERRVGKECGS